MKNIKNKKTIGYGYCGIWQDGTIGWQVPKYLYNDKHNIEKPDFSQSVISDNDVFVKCKITIEPMKDKRGNIIKRKAGYFRKF